VSFVYELRATLFRASGAPVSAKTTASSSPEVARFVADTVALAERERPVSMLLERDIELEPELRLTRDDLAEFRFGSEAGVGLDSARASWLRWYLQEMGARLDERPAGPLTLFTGSVLAALERPGQASFDDALAGDVFVPFRIGYDGEVEPRWLADHIAPVREELDRDPGSGLLGRLRSALGPLGMAPAPLPVAPPLYALPLLAHREEAHAELGRERAEAALALIRRVTAEPADQLAADARQELESVCLGAAGFENASRHALVRIEPPGLVVWASDPEPAAAVAAA
jgi:hypothetical protein